VEEVRKILERKSLLNEELEKETNLKRELEGQLTHVRDEHNRLMKELKEKGQRELSIVAEIEERGRRIIKSPNRIM
jgi:chromosome segregation ATPase